MFPKCSIQWRGTVHCCHNNSGVLPLMPLCLDFHQQVNNAVVLHCITNLLVFIESIQASWVICFYHMAFIIGLRSKYLKLDQIYSPVFILACFINIIVWGIWTLIPQSIYFDIQMRFHGPYRRVSLAEGRHFSFAMVVFQSLSSWTLTFRGNVSTWPGPLLESRLFIRKWPTHRLPPKMISALWSFCTGTPRRVPRLDILAFWQTTVTHYIWYFVLQVMWFILERKETLPQIRRKVKFT